MRAITVVFENEDVEFYCTECQQGNWVCKGKLQDDVECELEFTNSGITRVFQHLNHLAENKL